MYHEFSEERRIHQPYVDGWQRMSFWKPPMDNYGSANWRRGLYAGMCGLAVVEPIRHFASHVTIMNHFYEWPRTRSEYNIFFKEVFRMPDFWSELSKKMVFGTVAIGGSTAV